MQQKSNVLAVLLSMRIFQFRGIDKEIGDVQ